MRHTAFALLLLSTSALAQQVTCNDGTLRPSALACEKHGGVRNKGVRCRDGATSRRSSKDACANHGGVGSPDDAPQRPLDPGPRRDGDPDPRRDPL